MIKSIVQTCLHAEGVRPVRLELPIALGLIVTGNDKTLHCLPEARHMAEWLSCTRWMAVVVSSIRWSLSRSPSVGLRPIASSELKAMSSKVST